MSDPLFKAFVRYHYVIEREAMNQDVAVEDESFARAVEGYWEEERPLKENETIEDRRKMVLAFVAHCRAYDKKLVAPDIKFALEKANG